MSLNLLLPETPGKTSPNLKQVNLKYLSFFENRPETPKLNYQIYYVANSTKRRGYQ